MSLDVITRSAADLTSAEQELLAAWGEDAYGDQTWTARYAWTPAEWHLLLTDGGEPVSCLKVVTRPGTVDGEPVRLGGIGSVMTPTPLRGRGYASHLMRRARPFLFDELGVDLGLLFCLGRLVPFYGGLGGARCAPRSGSRRPGAGCAGPSPRWCSLPPAPRGATAKWTSVGCPGDPIDRHPSGAGMNIRARTAAETFACICLSVALAGAVRAQVGPTTPSNTPSERSVSTRATGTFEVQLAPQETAATLGRMSIDKQFHGDLQGTSKGEMLAAQGGVQGSAGYVALEQVTGTLHGRTGTFYLQHTGTMDRGAPSLSITVVPDTGTGELTGLTGRMNIIIEAGKHAYEFDYTLPGTS